MKDKIILGLAAASALGALTIAQLPFKLPSKPADAFGVGLAIILQAGPFLILGAGLAWAVQKWLPATFLTRLFNTRPLAGIGLAGLAGGLIPACECATAPIACSLMSKRVGVGAALAFMLASPAINPVVLLSTFTAYPARPEMVFARFVSGLASAVLVGVVCAMLAPNLTGSRHGHAHGFAADVAGGLGWLVFGGLAAGAIKVWANPGHVEALASNPIAGNFVGAGLAILMCLCSEADAFVAASLPGLSDYGQLVFMSVGPMVDFKLIAIWVGFWGKKFVAWFAPLVALVSFNTSSLVGLLLLR